MYRAVTWLTLQSGIAIDDEAAIAELVSRCEIEISGDPAAVSVRINGQDVTQVIRSLKVTSQVSAIAAQLLCGKSCSGGNRLTGVKAAPSWTDAILAPMFFQMQS